MIVITLEGSRFAACAVWMDASAASALRSEMILTEIFGRSRGVSVQSPGQFPICVPVSPQLVTYPLRKGASQLNHLFLWQITALTASAESDATSCAQWTRAT